MFDGFRKEIFIFFWCKLKMSIQWMFLQYRWNEPTEATISFKLQSTEHVLIAMRWRILWKPCTIGILESYHVQYGSWKNTCMVTESSYGPLSCQSCSIDVRPKLGILWYVCNGILVTPLDHYDTNIFFPCQTMPCATFKATVSQNFK